MSIGETTSGSPKINTKPKREEKYKQAWEELKEGYKKKYVGAIFVPRDILWDMNRIEKERGIR